MKSNSKKNHQKTMTDTGQTVQPDGDTKIGPLLDPYNRDGVEVSRGEGSYVWDAQGNRYLDFLGGVAVLALGHCHPHMVDALTRQANRLWHASNVVYTREQRTLAARITEASFAEAVFFNNSGSEAVDFSLKIVRKYFKTTPYPERWRVITTIGGFHGRSMAGIAAGGQSKLTSGFEPVVEGFDQVAFGDLEAIRAAITPQTAAIMIEPIQGDGGINVASPEYLIGLRALADEHELLLILDEVQTGIGRTGRLFAFEWAGIEPDIVATAKGLGAGFPIGAVLTTSAIARTIGAGSHGSTLGGAPLAMAVGHAVLDIILADGFMDGVERSGSYMRKCLDRLVADHPTVFSAVRGQGLLLGMLCAADSQVIRREARKAGLLVAPASNNVIRLLPPLNVTSDQIDEAIDVLNSVAMNSDCV